MNPGRGTLGGLLVASATLAMAVACTTLPATTLGPWDASPEDDAMKPTVDAEGDDADATYDAVTSDAADVERYSSACAAQLANSPPLEPPGDGLVLVADSRSGFSGTQGSCGWHYGYRDPSKPAAFVPMPVFEASLSTWFIVPVNASPWTRISRDLAHPNARAEDGGPLEHWIIRRWVSDVVGPVAIGVTTYKLDGNAGNGVVVRLAVDGKTVYLQPLATWDTAPRKFVASASLEAGSTVDLVIEPFDGDEAWDHTVALVRVWQ